MKLIDLLQTIYKNVTIWVAEDPTRSEGIFFGNVGDISLKTAKGYEVVSVYPESYPAIHGFTGISIIVKKVEG